ncbi:phosphoribosylanthranilate isomerase [Parvularcula oceani]|uniref:phosphoribosylanthranilate isomerase n=1 Tax=Parvularcula oceani TaxID=1247963 RepID=UPI000A55E5EE|nr:phosphoribosylanthranilate isomerase [Parvularcula oceani]
MPENVPLGLGRSGLVKICGLTDEAAMRAATLAGADLVGLVFVPGSPRAVTAEAARGLAETAHGKAAVVGLFQNPALSEIEEVLEQVPLDMIQLHGSEDAEDVARIGAGFGLPVIKAVSVRERGDLFASNGMPADLMLYDAKPPEGARAAGGHGATFDWRVLQGHGHRTPWLLAGGLTPDNAAEAVLACAGITGFRGLDVSSGVEAAKGVKDPALITRFVAAARAAMGVLERTDPDV